jgi:hypothetical protein
MQSTFDQFVAEQDAKNTIQLNIRKYCLMLCDALLMNFNKKGHTLEYKFYIEEGRKYHKIIMDANGSRSAHAYHGKHPQKVFVTIF